MVFETIAFANFAIRAGWDRGAYSLTMRPRRLTLLAIVAATFTAKAVRDVAVAKNRKRYADILAPSGGPPVNPAPPTPSAT